MSQRTHAVDNQSQTEGNRKVRIIFWKEVTSLDTFGLGPETPSWFEPSLAKTDSLGQPPDGAYNCKETYLFR